MFHHTHREKQAATVAGPVSLVILAVGLVVTAANLPMAWVVWPLGYGVVLPLTIGYAKRRERASSGNASTTERDPVADARERYVAGDIDELEFEARIETALEEERGTS